MRLTPAHFRTYYETRLDGQRLKSGQNALKCPFHDDRTASFSLNLEKGIWACHAGCGSGGVVDFERKLTGGDEATAWERVAEVLGEKRLGFGERPEAEFVYVDELNKPLFKTVKYRLPDGGKRIFQKRLDGKEGQGLEGVRRVLYHLPEVIRSNFVFICYAPDTEVLTPHGWVRFADLTSNDQVAQYNAQTAEINFVYPSARQRFSYAGAMFHFKSAFSDLLVTRDHRMLVRSGSCIPKVKRASDVKRGARLPVSGYRDSDYPPATEPWIRLAVAYQADGHRPRRGLQWVWNLKKPRKVRRLRRLLASCGIPYTEHHYPSAEGWTEFRVGAVHLVDIQVLLSPDKEWLWETLEWDAESREILLDELRYWDGDKASASTRYFTASRQNADVISALAVTSGRGSAVRCDGRRDRKNYVISIRPKQWQTLAVAPKMHPYVGDVYCCTVPSGFIVVRRNGKITVSGNCEGEKDADNLAAALEKCSKLDGEAWAATTNPMGAGKWMEEYSKYLGGKIVVILPDQDDAGRKHGEQVAQSVQKFARQVRVVNVPAGKDVSEWLAQGGDGEKLLELARQTPTWKPKVEGQTGIFVDAMQFMNSTPAEPEWLVDKVITRGANGIVMGDPKASKSLIATDLAVSLALGVKWFDFAIPRRVRCGMVWREDSSGLTARRIRRLWSAKQAPEGDMKEWLWVSTRAQEPTWLLDRDEDLDKLIAGLKGIRCELLLMDVFRRLHLSDENDNTEMQQILDRLTRVQGEVGCQIALVHHTNKGDGWIFQRCRGASVILGWTEWGMGVSLTNPDDQPDKWVRRLEFLAKEDEAAGTFYYRIAGHAPDPLRLEVCDPPERKGGRAQKVLEG